MSSMLDTELTEDNVCKNTQSWEDTVHEISVRLGRARRNIDASDGMLETKRLILLLNKFGNTAEVKKMLSDRYDSMATNAGFGSPDCSCHIDPPCQACINWTNYCPEREEACEVNGEPGCMIVNHDCEVVRNPA